MFAYISNACFYAFNNMGTASQEGTFSSSPLVLNQVDFKSKTLWWTFENFCQVGAWRCVSVYLWPLTQSSIFLSFRWLSSSAVKLQMNNNRAIQNKLWKLSWNKMFSLFNTIAFNLLTSNICKLWVQKEGTISTFKNFLKKQQNCALFIILASSRGCTNLLFFTDF